MDTLTLKNNRLDYSSPQLKKLWPVTVCSIGLLISYFLPWITFNFHVNLLITSIDKSFSGNGWDIARSLSKLGSLADNMDTGNTGLLPYSFLMDLTVVFATVNIIIDLAGLWRPTRFRFNEFLWGILSVAYVTWLSIGTLAYILAKFQSIGINPNSSDLSNVPISPGLGFWGMIIFSIVGEILSFFVAKPEKETFKPLELKLKKQSGILSGNTHRSEYSERGRETIIDDTSVQSDVQPSTNEPTIFPGHQDKISQLKKIKELLDAGVLTKEEFDNEKTKILS